MTAAQIAQELKLSIVSARHICSRLNASGALEVVGRIRVAGAHRPVHVYSVARQVEGIAGMPGCFPFHGVTPT
jgi:predicted ArsR family transcriptional regulator